jgi:hypothetical protein
LFWNTDEGAVGVIETDAPPTEERRMEEETLRSALENLSIGDTEESMHHTHNLADMLVAYATCPGALLNIYIHNR